MVLFALLLVLVIFVVVVLGFVGGLGMVALSLVFPVLAVLAWRSGRRGRSLALMGGALVLLIPGALILGLTWRLAAWFLPPLIAEHRKFDVDRRERPTLDPAKEEVRRFVKAEAMYHATNGSHFDTPECLARPQDCMPGYTGPPFLDAKTASLGQRGGFAWSFHPGPPPAGLEGMPGLSRSSIDTYALLGVPTGASDTSAHSVCGDFAGVCTFNGSDLHGQAACPGDCSRVMWVPEDTAPVIVAFEPAMALPGARIKLTASAYTNRIEDWRFGDVPAHNGSWGGTRVELVVPEGAVSGKISVVTPYGPATSASDFVVLAYTGLRVAPANVRLVAGQEQDLAVTASLSDGKMAEPKEGLHWASSAPAVAMVDGGGQITARSPGTARITASFEGLKAVATVSVVAPVR